MQKGISPIVAVVLLIAIAVIAAVGLYFWVGGLATQQPTTQKPIVISAQGLSCGKLAAGEWATAMVQNLDPSQTLAATLYIKDDTGTASNSTISFLPSSQNLTNFSSAGSGFTVGNTYVIYGTSGTSQAQFVIPSGTC
jgi:flagellin-like protein